MPDSSRFLSNEILQYFDNEEYIKSAFVHEFGPFKEFSETFMPFKSDRMTGVNQYTADDHNDYYINKNGYRGILDSDSEILGAGCSITFGIGVPEEWIWTNILGKKNHQSITNLGYPGASIEKICNSIISYVATKKRPKKIFCFFPSLFRSFFVYDVDYYSLVQKETKQIDNLHINHLYFKSSTPLFYIENKTEQMFMILNKKANPYEKIDMEHLLSPHQLMVNSINSIHMLELFCLSHNIDLCWTTWDFYSAFVINNLNKKTNFKLKKYKNFLDEKSLNSSGIWFDNWNIDKKFCNSDHSLNLKNNLCWDKGSDFAIAEGKKIKDSNHSGIHYQVHVAEFFEKYFDMV